jgi:hypothetical protein
LKSSFVYLTTLPNDRMVIYEGVSKSFRTGRLERELQMVQLSATRCSCIAILWVSLVSFAAITLCAASQRVFIVVVDFVIDLVRKRLDSLSYGLGGNGSGRGLFQVAILFISREWGEQRPAQENPSSDRNSRAFRMQVRNSRLRVRHLFCVDMSFTAKCCCEQTEMKGRSLTPTVDDAGAWGTRMAFH